MNPDDHARAHWDYWLAQLRADAEGIARHERFYDEYNAVLDMDAAYYLDTVRTVFQDFALARGTWRVAGQRVDPRAITSTPMFTIEGELDDISGLGQTAAALQLTCVHLGLPAARKHHLVAEQCGALRPVLGDALAHADLSARARLHLGAHAMKMLDGKTALVTGSTSGIGLGIAIALAEQGAAIILNGFGDIEAARGALAPTGARVGYHGADLARATEIEALVQYADTEFGGIDILVNNAGIQYVAPLDDFPPDRWDAILALNLDGGVPHDAPCPRCRTCTRPAGGASSSVASVHGQVASVGKAAYVAASEARAARPHRR